MRAGEKADAHQKFARDFASGKFESLAKEFDPFLFAFGMMRGEPFGEAFMRGTHIEDYFGVCYNRPNLEAVANDGCVI